MKNCWFIGGRRSEQKPCRGLSGEMTATHGGIGRPGKDPLSRRRTWKNGPVCSHGNEPGRFCAPRGARKGVVAPPLSVDGFSLTACCPRPFVCKVVRAEPRVQGTPARAISNASLPEPSPAALWLSPSPRPAPPTQGRQPRPANPAFRRSPDRRSLLRLSEDASHQCAGFRNNRRHVVSTREALGVQLVDILGPRRTEREPTRRGHYL